MKAAPAVGRMSGYFQVDSDGEYGFRLLGVNVGALLVVNARVCTNAYFQQALINSTTYIKVFFVKNDMTLSIHIPLTLGT